MSSGFGKAFTRLQFRKPYDIPYRTGTKYPGIYHHFSCATSTATFWDQQHLLLVQGGRLKEAEAVTRAVSQPVSLPAYSQLGVIAQCADRLCAAKICQGATPTARAQSPSAGGFPDRWPLRWASGPDSAEHVQPVRAFKS